MEIEEENRVLKSQVKSILWLSIGATPPMYAIAYIKHVMSVTWWTDPTIFVLRVVVGLCFILITLGILSMYGTLSAINKLEGEKKELRRKGEFSPSSEV